MTKLETLCGLLLALLAVTPARATIVPGGGRASNDCLAVFDVDTSAGSRARRVRCVDGESCDADGAVDGRCTMPVAVCVNATAEPRCTANGVEVVRVAHARDDGDPEFDPDFQVLQARVDAVVLDGTTTLDACAVPAMITVPIDGPLRRGRCRKGKKRITVSAVPLDLDARTDRDQIELVCEPSPQGCAARALFDGTFDRIQRQIFDRSCARSGCHDSQTVEGNLLLERGAAYGNLVGIGPSNGPAALADWKRVDAVGGPETSLLYHKVAGRLPDGFGARMPFGRKRLDPVLVDLIATWIVAGAPATGWVTGTD